jgi:hypothetical protein
MGMKNAKNAQTKVAAVQQVRSKKSMTQTVTNQTLMTSRRSNNMQGIQQ